MAQLVGEDLDFLPPPWQGQWSWSGTAKEWRRLEQRKLILHTARTASVSMSHPPRYTVSVRSASTARRSAGWSQFDPSIFSLFFFFLFFFLFYFSFFLCMCVWVHICVCACVCSMHLSLSLSLSFVVLFLFRSQGGISICLGQAASQARGHHQEAQGPGQASQGTDEGVGPGKTRGAQGAGRSDATGKDIREAGVPPPLRCPCASVCPWAGGWGLSGIVFTAALCVLVYYGVEEV